jgi:hypothetical protein
MRRTGESPWARWVRTELASRVPDPRILDFGCGYGKDVHYYTTHGLRAVGYDTAPMFGATALPDGPSSVITMLFVLNTIAVPADRLSAVRQAGDLLDDDGVMLIVTRSTAAIDKQARSRNWPAVGDGYWSSGGRRTFQRGIDAEELRHLGVCAGLTPASGWPQPPRVPDASSILLTPRRRSGGRAGSAGSRSTRPVRRDPAGAVAAGPLYETSPAR